MSGLGQDVPGPEAISWPIMLANKKAGIKLVTWPHFPTNKPIFHPMTTTSIDALTMSRRMFARGSKGITNEIDQKHNKLTRCLLACVRSYHQHQHRHHNARMSRATRVYKIM